MKITLERAPWHTVRDSTPRYKYDAIVTAHGVTMRTCRLSKKQVEKLLAVGVAVKRVKCRGCSRATCVCRLRWRIKTKPRRETHVGRK